MGQLTTKIIKKMRTLIGLCNIRALLESFKKYKANFKPWIKMPHWTLDEGTALLAELDPKYVDWDYVKNCSKSDQKKDLFIEFFAEHLLALRNIVLKAYEVGKITDPIAPLTFIAWAVSEGIEIPKALQKKAATLKKVKAAVEAETNKLLRKIAKLQGKIGRLQALAWQGSDEKKSTYSKELALAVKAHNAISKNWKKGRSIKKQIWMWLEENYPELLKEEKIRISKICNWHKKGGAPVTPSKKSTYPPP